MKAMTQRLGAALDGLSVLGPGLAGWTQTSEILSGRRVYERRPTIIPPAESLPPAERRRAGRVVNLALAAGQEATANAVVDIASLNTVFASSGADNINCHEILQTLCSEDRRVSPTRFHNSVHNVTAGYWSISTRDTAPYSVVCAYDGSFAAGLLEALSQVVTGQTDVLLVAYDIDYPMPLQERRPMSDAYAVALLLRPNRTPLSMATLLISLSTEPADRLQSTELEALRCNIPAARSLPLLACIAGSTSGLTHLDYLAPLSLAIAVTLCR